MALSCPEVLKIIDRLGALESPVVPRGQTSSAYTGVIVDSPVAAKNWNTDIRAIYNLKNIQSEARLIYSEWIYSDVTVFTVSRRILSKRRQTEKGVNETDDERSERREIFPTAASQLSL